MYFYQCSECENIVFSKEEKELKCCDKVMEKILPNQVLDGEELEDIHYLEVRKIGALYSLICEAEHPMVDVHHLEYAILETNKSVYFKRLSLDDFSTVDFLVGPEEEYVNAYLFCNQFGLIEAAGFQDLTKE